MKSDMQLSMEESKHCLWNLVSSVLYSIPMAGLEWRQSFKILLCSVLYMYLPVLVYGVTGRSNGVISSSPELGTDLELVLAV